MTLYDATGAKKPDTSGHSLRVFGLFVENQVFYTVPGILPESYLGESPGTSHPNFNQQDTLILGKAP